MKTAIVLGGTVPHCDLICQLKSRGYYTILVDYTEAPPAKEFADEHIRESTLDAETVLEIAKNKRADLIISACIDQANSVCCEVAEKLGLPHPYSYETSLDVTVKSRMKRILKQNGVRTSDYETAASPDGIDWSSVRYPAVVKPTDCNSSKGVKMVCSEDEARLAFTEALSLSRTHTALVEGFVEGIEIQVDCYASEKDVDIVMTRQKKQIERKTATEMNSSGSIIPAPVLENRTEQVAETARMIAKAFGLKCTPFFFQAIVDRSGNVNVLELAPRIGGGLSNYLLKEIAGFDAVCAVIDSYFGTAVHFSPSGRTTKMYSTNLLYMEEGIFDHIDGLEKVKSAGLAVEVFVTKNRGDRITGSMRSGNRVGAFVVEGNTLEELRQKEENIYSLIDILDPDNKSKMKRWRP